MNKKLIGTTGLIVLAVFFLIFNLVNNMAFKHARLDLTDQNLYTLSEGTKNILKSIDEPISLKFFFSAKSTEKIPQLKSFSKRVQEMLQEMESYSGGKLKLTVS